MKKVEIKEFKGLQAFVKPGEYEIVFNPKSKKLRIIGIDTDDVVDLDGIPYVFEYGKESRFKISSGQSEFFLIEKEEKDWKNITRRISYQLILTGI